MPGNNLQRLRIEKDLTQSQLGELFGLSKTAISLYESEKRGMDMELVKKLADFFNTTTDYVLGREVTVEIEMPHPGNIKSMEDIDRILVDMKSNLYNTVNDGHITQEKAAEILDLVRRQLLMVLEQSRK